MPHHYLEVTYRNGRPLAAYLYLPRQTGDRSVQVEQRGSFLVDWTEDGRPIGIEMPSPSRVTLSDLNHVLGTHGLTPVAAEELSPPLAAT